MEDLGHMQTIYVHLKTGIVDVDIARKLGKLLSKIHNHTAKELVSTEKWDEFTKKFRNTELKKVSEVYFISKAFDGNDSYNIIPKEMKDSHNIAVTKINELGYLEKALKLFDREICFVHGDCHTNAVFANANRIALFDFEFAFLGVPAFNLALLIPEYKFVPMRAGHFEASERTKETSKAREAVSVLISSYLDDSQIRTIKDDVGTFLSQLALLTGIFFISVSVFQGLEKEAKSISDNRRFLLELGTKLTIEHQKLNTIEALMDGIFEGEI